MKKTILLVCVLSISVITTACINSFAVQELNNKAMNFMDQGNYEEAIERLKSSIDLDESVFESHYNLAVAYTKAEDYVKALDAYKKAISLKPDFADSYYSLAVAEENIAADLNAGILLVDDNGNLKKAEKQDGDEEFGEVNLSESTKVYLDNILKDSIKNYNIYLEKSPDTPDAEEVQSHIKDLELKITGQPSEE